MQSPSLLLTACGGFLFAVLWMDLLFDVQVLPHRRSGRELPESVLASIATYYRRVTTTSRPMGHLVGAVMVVTVIALLAQIATGDAPRWLAPASLLACGGPIALDRFVPFLERARLESEAHHLDELVPLGLAAPVVHDADAAHERLPSLSDDVVGAIELAGEPGIDPPLLLDALRTVGVEQFVFSSTLLVHAPSPEEGARINEDSPLAPAWPIRRRRPRPRL